MKFLIIDTYYPAFLNNFYSHNSKIKNLPYKNQKRRLLKQLFGTSDFYSRALTQLGHPSQEVIVNNHFIQQQWQKENLNPTTPLNNLFKELSLYKASNELSILEQQINHFRPDVIYNQDISYLDPGFLFSIKSKVKLIVGQIACPLPPRHKFTPYDLLITSFPHYLAKFKKIGIAAEYLPLCFEASVLEKIPHQKRIYDLTFIGGISPAHKKSYQLLVNLAERIKIDIWGYGKQYIDPRTKLYQYHHGEAWGKDMYRLMCQSKLTLNRHIDVAKDYANNMRLYEATGCGAMLLTDTKRNLDSLFEIDKEVVTYQNLEELMYKIQHYLDHDRERKQIARRGQLKTLRKHNYTNRMQQLIDIISQYL